MEKMFKGMVGSTFAPAMYAFMGALFGYGAWAFVLVVNGTLNELFGFMIPMEVNGVGVLKLLPTIGIGALVGVGLGLVKTVWSADIKREAGESEKPAPSA